MEYEFNSLHKFCVFYDVFNKKSIHKIRTPKYTQNLELTGEVICETTGWFDVILTVHLR